MKVLKLTPHDNVGTALQDLKKGDTFQIGTDIVKYAHVIGRASIDIQSGELVHVHNIEGTRGRGDLN